MALTSELPLAYSLVMISASEIRKLTSEVENLKQEVGRLRSLLISVAGEDREGAYRASIVREMLEAATEQPTREYAGPGSLLKQLTDQR
jgi:hypothetical protein